MTSLTDNEDAPSHSGHAIIGYCASKSLPWADQPVYRLIKGTGGDYDHITVIGNTERDAWKAKGYTVENTQCYATMCDAADCASCGSALSSCGNMCVDQTTDIGNCGGCGNACAASEVCIAGSCAASGP